MGWYTIIPRAFPWPGGTPKTLDGLEWENTTEMDEN